ncbi:MAG: ABC transporter ATP-binding protein [Clostridiales bacterium]|nr:ABC transporter ATP-binding protein [Clostridiales bacterium]
MFKILKKITKQEWLMVLLTVGLIFIQVWLDLKLPDYMGEITILIQSPSVQMSQVWQTGGMMILCALGSLVSAIGVGYIAATLASNLSSRLRELVYSKIQGFSMEEINNFSTASLITRSTNDITQVQQTITMGLQVLIKAPILAVWSIIKISGKNWQWSLTTGIAVFVMAALLTTVLIFALPKFKKVQKQTDDLNKATRENLTGVRVIRAYNAEKFTEDKFANANNSLTKTYLFTTRLMAVMQPGMMLVMNGLSLAIYWIGAYLINGAPLAEKATLLADMITYSSYAMQVVSAFMMLIMLFVMLPRASVSAKRVNEVLETKECIQNGQLQYVPINKGEVVFDNVGFKYPDASEYVLKNISFTAKAGEVIAFIGSTGSGKSTLINLIPRFYDATEGAIYIDGVNIKDYPLEMLHNKIGYIAQKAVLFSGDIKYNIDFGESNKQEITQDDIYQALEIAQAKDFVENLPHKINYNVAQNGTNFSGGQKQRLAIARAIARKPELYIFDDSFSALDYKTDKKLREELVKYTKDSITFIVAQRIGTIRNADKIIVLSEGKIVGMGKHEQLLKSCPVYKEIALSQLSKEEL